MLPMPAAMHGKFLYEGAVTALGGGSIGAGYPAAGVTLPVGARAGDMIVWVGVLSGGSAAPYSTVSDLRYRFLEAADLAPGALTISGGPSLWQVYRGPFLIQLRSSGGPVLSGFTKSGAVAGILMLAFTNGATSSATMSAPFVSRHFTGSPAGGGAYNSFHLYDLLTPASYTDGASVTVSFPSPGTSNAVLLEMLY